MIHVALIGDDHYAAPMAAVMASMSSNLHAGDAVLAHVFAINFKAEDRKRLAQSSLSPRLQIEFHDSDPRLVREFASDLAHVSTASFYRLFLPDLLLALDRVIYLDGDILVRGSLQELWETDIRAHSTAGVRDASILTVAAPGGLEDWRELRLDPHTVYCNAGVMLIDLARWRSQSIPQRAAGYLRRHGGRTLFGDQAAINAGLAGDWVMLDSRWNVQSEYFDKNSFPVSLLDTEDYTEAVQHPMIAHFTGPDKPWMPHCTHPLAGEWRAHLDRTPYAGWSLGPPAKPVWKRAIGRVQRAMRVLIMG